MRRVVEMNKQEILQKVLELNKKTKALKKVGSDAEAALQLAQEIRTLETEIVAAKVTP
jgi:hypothetical protein